MKQRRRRFFTLIEVLIALTLMAFLSTTLFFWVRFALTTNRSFQDSKWVYLEERYCRERLEELFSKSVYDLKSPLEEKHTFYSRENSCVFVTDLGTNPSPLLSKHVLIELYLTDDHLLAATLWPVPIKDKKIATDPSLTLPLLSAVDKIELSFYCPPDPSPLIVKPAEIGPYKPTSGWNSVWKKEAECRPALIKLVIHRQKIGSEAAHKLVFLFETDASNHPIIFNKLSLGLSSSVSEEALYS
jgi:hypothetical protein